MQIATETRPNSTIRFYGDLAQYPEVCAEAWTPAALLRAACALRPGLRASIAGQAEYRIYIGEIIAGRELEHIGLHLRVPAGTIIHIVPTAHGAKGRGASIGKIAIGAALVVGAIVAAPAAAALGASLGATAFSVAGFSVSYGAIATFGAMTMLGGIAGLISYSKKKDAAQTNRDGSTTLSGSFNVATQGTPVPLVYGRLIRVGSNVISAGYSAEDWKNSAANAVSDGQQSNYIGGESPHDAMGAKGGKSGSDGGGSSNAADTLRSKAVVRIIDLLGEGPGVSLANGAKSIYFNGTPLMAADGTYNFNGVQWSARTGTPDQDPVTGFPASESTTTVGTQVLYSNPVTVTLSNNTATAARVTVKIPSLYTVDSKNGTLQPGKDLSLTIQVQVPDGSWNTVATDTFHGQKCTATYEKSYRFDLPDSQNGEWNIRVSKTTPDPTLNNDVSSLYFEAYDAINDHLLIYPNSAYVAFIIDSASFGGNVPTRTYDVTGKEISIPANYDPVGRTYANSGPGTANGTWDGVTWKQANAVDDPCWCFLDMLSSSRYGLGQSASKVAGLAYDLYAASQYAAQSVPDGFGGTEPRYALNVCVNGAGDAYKVVQQFAGSFRGMPYWANGSIQVSVDMPQEPVLLVTNANVIDGLFTYEGTGASGRHNVCSCEYVDMTENAMSNIETYSDTISVSNVGYRSTTVEGFGVTSRGLARRLAHWAVDTELHQTQTVNYSAGIDHASVRPGEIIAVADEFYQGARLGGRCWAGSTSTAVFLDQAFTPDGQTDYSIKTTNDDGTISTSNVSSFSTRTDADGVQRTTANLQSSITAPSANAMYLLTEPENYQTPQFMVLDVKETSHGIYQVTGIQYDPKKYDRVENNAPFNAATYSNLPTLLATPLPVATNVGVYDEMVGIGNTTVIRTVVSWTAPVSSTISGARVSATSQSTGQTTYYEAGQNSYQNIDGLPIDTYTFGVQMLGTNGRSSAWVYAAPLLVNGKEQPPPAPIDLVAQGGVRLVNLTWQAVPIRNLLYYVVQRAPFANNVTSTGWQTLGNTSSTNFTDSDHATLLPSTQWIYQVQAVTTLGTPGLFSAEALATTSYLLTADLEESIRDTAAFAQTLRDAITDPQLVSGVPANTNGYAAGQIISDETQNGRLYENKNGRWVPLITTVSVQADGKLTADQIKFISTAQVTTPLSAQQVALLQQAQADSSLSAAQQASITAAISSGTSSQDILNILASLGYRDGTAALLRAPSNNLIYDGCGQTTCWTEDWNINLSVEAPGTNFALGNDGSLGAQINADRAASDWSAVSWQPPNTYGCSVTAGEYVELQVMACADTAGAEISLYIDVFDASGNKLNISQTIAPVAVPVVKTAQNISAYQLVYVLGLQIPANAVWARPNCLLVGKQNTNFYLTRFLCGVSTASATQPMTWVNGATPLVDASNIVGKIISSQLGTISGTQIDNTLTMSQISNLSLAGMAGQITSTQISNNSITTPMIQAGAVNTAAIAAASITAEKLVIGSPSNVIWNPSGTNTTDGWQWSVQYISNGQVKRPYVATRQSPSVVNAEGGLFIQYYGSDKLYSNQGMFFWWTPNGSNTNAVSCSYGQRVSASAFVICGALAFANITISFYDVNGNAIAAGPNVCTDINSYAQTNNVIADFANLSNYVRIGCMYDVPKGAVSMVFTLWFSGSDNGISQPFGQMCKAQLGYVSSNVTQTPQYTPGGVTAISGSVITTGTLNADRLVANSITTGLLAAASVTALNIAAKTITTNEIAASTITGQNIAAGTITAANIAVGTITAANIAAGSITANVIAAGAITAQQIQAASITGACIAAQTITAANIAVGTITAQQIAVGGITAENIAANTITSQQIATGSIAAESLMVGSPSNLVGNSAFDPAGPVTAGWTFSSWGGNTPATPATAVITTGTFSCLFLGMTNGSTVVSGGGLYGYTNVPIPATPGVRYCASAWMQSQNGIAGTVEIHWFDINGNDLGHSASSQANFGGVSNLSEMIRVAAFSVCPSGAATGQVRLVGQNMLSGSVSNTSTENPGIHAAQVQFGPVGANVSVPPDYVAGGTTSIDGSMIRTGTLDASRIVAGSITSWQIAAFTLKAENIMAGTITAAQIASQTITGEQIAANTITAGNLAANSITAGVIQAGAIGTEQLAAGSVNATILAGSELIVSQAQIGNLVVGTSNIIDDSATTFVSFHTGNSYTGQGDNNTIDVTSVTFSIPTARVGYVSVNADHHNSGGNDNNLHHQFYLYCDGQEIRGKGGYLPIDYPNFIAPVSLSAGSHTLDLKWWGGSAVTLTNIDIIVMMRAK